MTSVCQLTVSSTVASASRNPELQICFPKDLTRSPVSKWLLTPVLRISECSTSQSTPNVHSQDVSWWQHLPPLRPSKWSTFKHLRSCPAALPDHSPDLFCKRLSYLASLHASSSNVHTVFDAVAYPSEPSDNFSCALSTHLTCSQDSEANSRSATSQKKREADSLHRFKRASRWPYPTVALYCGSNTRPLATSSEFKPHLASESPQRDEVTTSRSTTCTSPKTAHAHGIQSSLFPFRLP